MDFVMRDWENNATECVPFLCLTFLGPRSAVSQNGVAQQQNSSSLSLNYTYINQ
jgi:hypothetical protein